MKEPVPWIFFCTEADYPKYLALLPDIFPPTYREFVSHVDKRIKNVMEQYTIVKSNVSFDEFIAYCAVRQINPDYDTLLACTFHVWGKNR